MNHYSPQHQSSQETSHKAIVKRLQLRPFKAEDTSEQLPDPSAKSSAENFSISHPTTCQNVAVTGPSITPLSQPIQAKLTTSAPNDKYEQEADRVAHEVLQRIYIPAKEASTALQDSAVTQHNQTFATEKEIGIQNLATYHTLQRRESANSEVPETQPPQAIPVINRPTQTRPIVHTSTSVSNPIQHVQPCTRIQRTDNVPSFSNPQQTLEDDIDESSFDFEQEHTALDEENRAAYRGFQFGSIDPDESEEQDENSNPGVHTYHSLDGNVSRTQDGNFGMPSFEEFRTKMMGDVRFGSSGTFTKSRNEIGRLIQTFSQTDDIKTKLLLAQYIKKHVDTWVKKHQKELDIHNKKAKESFWKSEKEASNELKQMEVFQAQLNGNILPTLDSVANSRLEPSFEDHVSSQEINQLLNRNKSQDFKNRYLKKIEQGRRLLSEDEINELKSYSKDTLNKEIKTGTYEDAIAYINKKNYKDWLKIHPNQRLLITSLIWLKTQKAHSEITPSQEYLESTPAYQMALSLAGDTEKIRKYTKDSWTNTLEAGMQLDDAKKDEIWGQGTDNKVQGITREQADKHTKAMQVLKRIFLLMQAGLQERVKEAEEKAPGPDFTTWSENVATALSHGGRVNVRIPPLLPGEDDQAILHWLGITNKGEIVDTANQDVGASRRSFGTHHVNVGASALDPVRDGAKDLVGSKSPRAYEKFEEQGGIKASLTNLSPWQWTKLYGMNIAVGGIGNADYNGDYVLPDGGHGHIFIGYSAPTSRFYGALQIGCETTAPGAESTVGYHHGITSSEATANPLSSAGGAKADKHGVGKLDLARIELVSLDLPILEGMNNWLGKLKKLESVYDEAAKNKEISVADLVGGRMDFMKKLSDSSHQ